MSPDREGKSHTGGLVTDLQEPTSPRRAMTGQHAPYTYFSGELDTRLCAQATAGQLEYLRVAGCIRLLCSGHFPHITVHLPLERRLESVTEDPRMPQVHWVLGFDSEL